MLHTKLFEKFPDKFNVQKNDDGRYVLVGRGNIEEIYSFLQHDPLYKNVELMYLDEQLKVICFLYSNEEMDDYSETIEFDKEKLSKTFPYILNIRFVEYHLPYTRYGDYGDYYVISIPENESSDDLISYMFNHFGYIKLSGNTINNERILRFRNHESYCSGKI